MIRRSTSSGCLCCEVASARARVRQGEEPDLAMHLGGLGGLTERQFGERRQQFRVGTVGFEYGAFEPIGERLGQTCRRSGPRGRHHADLPTAPRVAVCVQPQTAAPLAAALKKRRRVDVGFEFLADQWRELLDRVRRLGRTVGVQLDDFDLLDGRGAAATSGTPCELPVDLRDRTQNRPDGIADRDVGRRVATDQQHRQAHLRHGGSGRPASWTRPSRSCNTYWSAARRRRSPSCSALSSPHLPRPMMTAPEGSASASCTAVGLRRITATRTEFAGVEAQRIALRQRRRASARPLGPPRRRWCRLRSARRRSDSARTADRRGPPIRADSCCPLRRYGLRGGLPRMPAASDLLRRIEHRLGERPVVDRTAPGRAGRDGGQP